MLVAKSEIAHVNLVKMFQNHDIDRKYLALVWGIPEKTGIIKKSISRSRIDRKKMTVSENGKKAITKWKVLDIFLNFITLAEFKLETGRTHQIRVHMSHLGYNIVGDQLYGKKSFKFLKNNKLANHKFNEAKIFPRQALHSHKIAFQHPITQKPMFFQCDLPEDINLLIKKLI